MTANRIITFANQKGGVGKTTLCTLFAEYLSAKGEPVRVLDCDLQQTIYTKRNEDTRKYPGNAMPFEVQPVEITIPQNVKILMDSIKNSKERIGNVLIDAPGNLSQQGLVPIFVMSDYIICPFQFESSSINSTATFVGFILKLQKMIPQMRTHMVFVVNRWMKTYGRKPEWELWNKTEDHLGHFGLVAPRIEQKAEMQRYNTMELMPPIVPIVTPAFEVIYNHIFKPNGNNEK